MPYRRQDDGFPASSTASLGDVALGQGELLVGAALAFINDELGAVLGRGPRVIQAQRAAVRLQLELAVGQLTPLLIRAAGAGLQDDLGAAAAGPLVVKALAVGHEPALAECPGLARIRAAARPDA